MKIKIVAIVLMLLLNDMVFPQEVIDTAKLKKLKDMLILNQQVKKANKDFLSKINEGSLKKTVKTIYEANENAPIEVKKILKEDHIRWLKDTVVNEEKRSKAEQYQVIMGQFENLIKSRYQRYVYWNLRIPVFVKAKILNIKSENKLAEMSGHTNITYTRYIVTAKIEEVLQGQTFIGNKKEFELYYVYWEPAEPENDFRVGKTYLLPLWNREIDDNPPLAVSTVFDNHGARFIVENDFLIDNYNAFQLGNKIKWSDFLNKFNDRIYRIKNMLKY